WIYDAVSLNPMYWAARQPETLLMAAIYRFHPKFAGKVETVWGDPLRDYGLATLEGGDIMPVGNGSVLIGMGERTSPQAIGQLANALFERGTVHRVVACQMPSSRPSMHLDTVFTFCGGNVVTAFRELTDQILCY